MFRNKGAAFSLFEGRKRDHKPGRNRQRVGHRSFAPKLEGLEARQLLSVTGGATQLQNLLKLADARPYVENELVIAMRTGDGDQALTAAFSDGPNWLTETGEDSPFLSRPLIANPVAAGGGLSLFSLTLPEGTDVKEAMAEASTNPLVVWAAPNFIYESDPRDLVPNDSLYAQQYHHPLMQNDLAWDITLGDSSVIVAVTDDGVDLGHEDLAANIWTNTGEIPGNSIDDDANGYIDDVHGWDFSSNDNDPNPVGGDDHGTHVSGIAAGDTNNLIGIAGTAGGATIMPIRFYGSGAWTSTVIAASYAYAVDNGAQIISTSYNVDGFVGDPTFEAGLDYIYDQGALHFNSAGNGNQDNSPRSIYDQSLYVVSTTSSDTRSSFSNYGTLTDISAPGSSILSTVLSNGYGSKSGTSMATPNAAGVAALIWSEHPDWTREQVVSQLLGTADDIDALNPGFEGKLGTGRVNSYQALTGAPPAPLIGDIEGLPEDGGTITEAPTKLLVDIPYLLDPTTTNNPANWVLRSDGQDNVFDTADDEIILLTLETDYMIGSNFVEFSVGTMPFEHYQFRAVSGGLTDPFGTPLNGLAESNNDFVLEFDLVVPPIDWVRADPLGSLIFEFHDTSAVSTTALEYPTELLAGQKISLEVVPEDSSATLSVEIRSGLGVVDTATASAPGAPVRFQNLLIPLDGDYTVEIGSDLATSYSFSASLNAELEAELSFESTNDSLIAADGLDDTAFLLASDRLAVLGQIDNGKYSQSLTESGNVFSPNVLTFELSGAEAPLVDGTLRLEAIGDFGLSSEFVTVEAEGILLGDFFTSANDDLELISEEVTISQADLALLAADGVITFTVSPSFEVNDLGLSELTLSLDYLFGVPDQDIYSFTLATNDVAALVLAGPSVETGLQLELLDSFGNLVSSGTSGQENASQMIIDFVAPVAGTYFARVTSSENESYSLVVTRDVAFESEANNDFDSPDNIDVAGSVLGAAAFGPAPITTETEPNDDGVVGGSPADLLLANDLTGSFVPLGGDTYEAVVTGTIASGNDVDWDFFKIVASPGDELAVALNGNTLADPLLRLFDSSGIQIAENDDSGTLDSLLVFSAFPTQGEYYIVADSFSSEAGSYTMTVTLETTSLLRSADDDFFSFETQYGQPITLTTGTPKTGPNAAANDLNPAIELYDPTGALVASAFDNVDGRNATLTHTPEYSGLYRARVVSESGSGEYLLEVSGNTGGSAFPFVVNSIPADATPLSSVPTIFTVDWSEAIDLTTVDEFDLVVTRPGGGLPLAAVDVQVVDGDRLAFTLDPSTDVGEGIYTVEIAGGAVHDLQQQPNVPFFASFEVDETAPRVVASSVLEGDVFGTGLTEISLNFDEELDASILDVSDVLLVETQQGLGPITISTFDYDSNTSVLRLGFAALPEGQYEFTLISGPFAAADLVGNALDGEPDALSTVPSGNGDAGGNFFVNFVVDVDTEPIPTPLDAKPPLGSLIYDPPVTGVINSPGDIDSFTIDVDPGQTITVLVEPAAVGNIGNLGTTFFDIDSSLSSFTVSGDFGGQALFEQAPGSLDVTVDGLLSADLVGGTVGFSGGSIVDLVSQPGPFEPFGLPADFAASVNLGVIGIANAAVRGFVTDVFASPTPLSPSGEFDVSSMVIEATEAAIDFEIPGLITDSLDLVGAEVFNNPAVPATIVQVDDTLVMTVPLVGVVEVEESLTGLILRLEVLGQIVATTDAPEPPADVEIVLRDPSSAIVASVDSHGQGAAELIQTYGLTEAGEYTIEVIGKGDGVGLYELTTVLNAAWDTERLAEPGEEDALVEEQRVEDSFIPLDAVARRGAVLGEIDPFDESDVDYYTFDLLAGQGVSLALTGQNAGDLQLDLFLGDTTLLATGVEGAANVDSHITNFQAPFGATYTARVSGDAGTQYSLVLVVDGHFGLEPFSSEQSAQPIDSSAGVLGHVSSPESAGVAPGLVGVERGGAIVETEEPLSESQAELRSSIVLPYSGEIKFSVDGLRPSTEVSSFALSLSIPGPETFDTIDSAIPLLIDFPGPTDSRFIPPDPTMAAGPEQIVALVNTQIGIYDKLTGAELFVQDLSFGSGFFAEVGATEAVFDPWVVYDTDSERFFAVAIDIASNTESNVFLAVSTDATPTDGDDWHKYKIDFTDFSIGSGAHFPDYPKMSVDGDAVWISANYFPIASGSGVYAGITAISKAELLSGGPANIVYDEKFNAFSVFPVQHYGDDAPGQYFVESTTGSGSSLTVHVVTNVLTAPTRSTTTVAVPSFQTPINVPQLGSSSTADSIDSRIMTGVYRDGSIWVSHGIRDPGIGDGENVARWYEIASNDFGGVGVPSLLQSGNVDPGPGIHAWMPSISVDASGNMAIGFAVGGPNQYYGAGYTGRLETDPVGTTILPVGSLREGEAPYTQFRWGDYTGISIDPADDATFWIFNEYATAAPGLTWATQIGAFQLASPVDEDWYEFDVIEGDELSLETHTPASGFGEFVNQLDPFVELIDPDGLVVAADDDSGAGNNAALSYTALLTGTYRVRVAAKPGTNGEYFLSVDGSTAENPPPEVIDTDPDDGLIVSQFPETYTLDFSEALMHLSVDPGDLFIGGLPAIDVTQIDGNTYEFTINPLVDIGDGTYEVVLAAGQVGDLQFVGNLPFSSTFIVDRAGPQVLATEWNNGAFPGTGVFAEGPLVFEALFNEQLATASSARRGPLTPGKDDILLENLLTGELIIAESVEFDSNTLLLTAEFGALSEGSYQLTLVSGDGAFEDLVGNDLDGEPLGPGIDGTPSGNGILGGNYTITFDVDNDQVAAADFVRLEPLGSLIFASHENAGVISSAGDTDGYIVDAEAGETIAAILTPSDPAVTLTVELVGLSGPFVAPAPGEPVVLPATALLSDGSYEVRVSGDSGPAAYNLDIYRNTELEAADTSDGNELPVDGSFVQLGSGRFAVVGTSESGVTLLDEDFEEGLNGFTIDNSGAPSAGLWHLSTGRGLQPGHSAEFSLYFGTGEGPDGGGNFDVGHTAGRVTSPVIDLTSVVDPKLTFSYVLETEGAPAFFDRAVVLVSQDDGPFVPLASNVLELIDPTTGWTEATLDLSLFAGSEIQIRFDFDTVDSVANGFEGWYVDDVRVFGAGDPDVDEYLIDLTGKADEPIDIILAGIDGGDFSGSVLQILDLDGFTVLATGVADPLGVTADNYDLGILDFVVPADGVYTIRFESLLAGDYSVVVTDPLAFETESNSFPDLDPLRNITEVGNALGYLDATPAPLLGTFEFVIDPSETFLELSADINGEVDIVEQTPGSLVALFDGLITADLTPTSIAFGAGSSIGAIEKPGPFEPLDLPADMAGMAELLPGLIVTAAFRDIIFESTSGIIPVDETGQFDASAVGFEVASGRFDFDVPGLISGSEVLVGTLLFNEATDAGQVTLFDESVELLIPIGAVVEVVEPSTGLVVSLEFVGQIVARAPRQAGTDSGDYYEVDLVDGQSLTLATQTLLDQSTPLNSLDPQIKLFGPNGELIASDDNSADGKNARLTTTVEETGTYRILVEAGSGVGEYLLSIDSEGEATASIAGPTEGVRGQPRLFTLEADVLTAEESLPEFTFDIDWDNDGNIDETVVGPSGLQVEHIFPKLGTFDVRVVATSNTDNSSTEVFHGIEISALALQADPNNPGVTNLAWGGTQGVDAVYFWSNSPGSVVVFEQMLNDSFDSHFHFFEDFNGKILAYGQDSADVIAAGFFKGSSEFYGGNGDDVLVGGRDSSDLLVGGPGNDIILGGTQLSDGSDTLQGGEGRDILIGNLGPDLLDGGSGEDLLLEGRASFDNISAAVFAIQAEWLSSRDYVDRVANISGTGVGDRLNGNYFLTPGDTAINDGALDQLVGGGDLDWFLYDFFDDIVNDPEADEIETDL